MCFFFVVFSISLYCWKASFQQDIFIQYPFEITLFYTVFPRFIVQRGRGRKKFYESPFLLPLLRSCLVYCRGIWRLPHEHVFYSIRGENRHRVVLHYAQGNSTYFTRPHIVHIVIYTFHNRYTHNHTRYYRKRDRTIDTR